MEKKKTGLWVISAVAIALGTVVIGMGPLSAQETVAEQTASKETANNAQKLTQRVTDEVMSELHESDFLQKEIDVGIERYIRKHRPAHSVDTGRL